MESLRKTFEGAQFVAVVMNVFTKSSYTLSVHGRELLTYVCEPTRQDLAEISIYLFSGLLNVPVALEGFFADGLRRG